MAEIPLAEELRFLALQCAARARHPDRGEDRPFLAELARRLGLLAGPQERLVLPEEACPCRLPAAVRHVGG